MTLRQKLDRFITAWRSTGRGCWHEDVWPGVRHTCALDEPLHEGDHACCCGYSWNEDNSLAGNGVDPYKEDWP